MDVYNTTVTDSQIQKTNWSIPVSRENGGEDQDRGMGLRDTNYYVQSRYATKYIVQHREI